MGETSKRARGAVHMPTLLLTHQACLAHDTGNDHPESAERLQAVLTRLRSDEFSTLEWREAPSASHDQLTRVHDKTHVAKILGGLPPAGREKLGADTVVSPGSGEAARRAAGAVCAAVDAVASGEAGNAFCAVRPPGHHAGPAQSMGFACSTTSPSARPMLARRMVSNASPSSISTFTTAMEPSRYSCVIPTRSLPRSISGSSSPNQGGATKQASETSSTCRSK